MKKVVFYCDVCGKDIEDALHDLHKILMHKRGAADEYIDVCPKCFAEILFQISKLKKKNGEI